MEIPKGIDVSTLFANNGGNANTVTQKNLKAAEGKDTSIAARKQAEEEAQKEIESYKSKIEDKIIQLESELEKAIAAAKDEGEKLVDSSVEKATNKANTETQKTIEEAKTKSKNIVSQITAQNAQDIIKILLKGVE